MQEQSDKDDEANDTNDFCELVNNELWIIHYSPIHKIHNSPLFIHYYVWFFFQEQSDKDDDANDPNDDGEPVAKKSKTMFEEQAIPSEVFGSLKKDE